MKNQKYQNPNPKQHQIKKQEEKHKEKMKFLQALEEFFNSI